MDFAPSDLLFYAGAGFLAQLVDSALGMAFGTLSSSLLLAQGFPPRAISAVVHLAEIFSSGASALAHWRLKNIDTGLLKRLAPPAILGALCGAALVLYVPSDFLKPWISGYFCLVGLVLVAKALRPALVQVRGVNVGGLGFLGGFLDAFGGAGWGEFVSSGLLLRGTNARATVGTLNATEFLVTTAVSLVFVSSLGFLHWEAVAAIALGGMVAAPLGALIKRAPTRALTIAVGLAVTALGLKSFF